MSTPENEKEQYSEVEKILSDVDQIFSGWDEPPRPKGSARPPDPLAPAARPPAVPIPTNAEEAITSPPAPKAPRPEPVTVKIEWATEPPKEVPAERVRRIGIAFCPESAAKVANFVKFLQASALKSSQNPIFPIPAFVEQSEPDDFPPGLGRARETDVDALIVIVPSSVERRDFGYVLPESRPISRVLTMDELERRMMVVDLLVDMMLIKREA